MSYLVPALVVALFIYAYAKKTDVYGAFIAGAKETFPLLLHVLPPMAAMMAALTVLRSSGALAAVIEFTAPAFEAIGLKRELVPLFVLRPFSGSAAMALLKDVFDAYGVDSFSGYAASVMLGSTETIFYTIALYFGAVGVTKTRYTVPVALLAGIVGTVGAMLFAYAAY
ncbi:MAG: nucleoside recognition domain-containing protein [Clostridiaceae bacterium]|nr:spore maturation protein [Eubacteriales bacterium]